MFAEALRARLSRSRFTSPVDPRLARAARAAAPRSRAGTAVESLENRLLFCNLHPMEAAPGPATPAAIHSLPAGTTYDANGLPLLTSRASGLKIFLDFDGYADSRGINDAPFDLDGTTSSFNATEQSYIYDTWRDIASYFAPFDVNVTTVQPPTGNANPTFVWHRITSTSQPYGGASDTVGGFDNSLSHSYTVNSSAQSRHSGIAHEIAHQLGLQHQSEFNAFEQKTAEYTQGLGDRDRAIIGIDYNTYVRRFFYGRNTYGTLVDDVQTIADTVKQATGDIDGFRPDDYSPSTLLATDITSSGVVQGVNERLSDVDAFKFTVNAGTYRIRAKAIYESSDSPKIELSDSSGNLIAARDDAAVRNASQNAEELTVTLPQGTYFLRVSSSGDEAEIGEYELSVTSSPMPSGNWQSADIGQAGLLGDVSYNASTATLTQSGGGVISGQADSLRFTASTMYGNGSITARLTQTGSSSSGFGGVMIRSSLNVSSPFAFLGRDPTTNYVQALSRTQAGQYSDGFIDAPLTPLSQPWLRITRQGTVFTFESSPDGSTWTAEGSTTIAMPDIVYVGLATGSGSNTELATAAFQNIAISSSTVNALTAPTGLTASPAAGASTGVALSWNDVSGETGYEIQRSVDGLLFEQAGTVGANVVSYTDANLFGSMRYFYRVVALDSNASTLRGTPGVPVSVINKPSAPTAPSSGYASPAAKSLSSPSIYLNWLDVQGDEGYKVEKSSDGGANYTLLGTTPKNATGYDVTSGLSIGGNYVFRITPVTLVGDQVAPSYLINAQTLAGTPTGVVLTAKQNNSLSIEWNDLGNEPAYRVQRSPDGITWTDLVDLAANVTYWTDTTVQPQQEYHYHVAAKYDSTHIGTYSTDIGTTIQPTPSTLPAGWTDADVATVGVSGAAGYSSGTGTFNVLGSGSGVGSSSDVLNFASRWLIGDGSIQARIPGGVSSNGSSQPYAGIMIRETASASSAFAAVSVRPTELRFEIRSAGGSTTLVQSVSRSVGSTYYLKLARAGNVFTAMYSTNGTSWLPLYNTSSPPSVSMTNSVRVGLVVASATTSKTLNVAFDNVSVTGSAGSDATAPSAPTISSVSTDTGSSSTDRITSDNTLSFSGTAEANSVVTLSRTSGGGFGSGVIGTTTANGSGNWTFNHGSVTLPEGQHSFTATATDSSGNTSTASSTFAVTVDRTAAVAATFQYETGQYVQLTPRAPDTISTLVLSGVGARNSAGTFFPATVDSTGKATFSGGSLPDGNYTLEGTATDVAGNTSTLSLTFFVLMGDANRDRVVDDLDKNIVLANFGLSGRTWSTGDFNYDGVCGPGDFNLLASNFGASV